VGQALGLDPSLIKAVIKTESNFNPMAVSKAGAKGLMQLMPGTAKEMGVSDPFNAMENIWGGAKYLKRMLDSYGGNLNKALAAYNWGPGNYRKHGGKSMPKETRRYIEVVNRNYNRFKKETESA
jgi:soluble lytic murein transglycosylase-like protein